MRRFLIPAMFLMVLSSPVLKNQASAYVLPSQQLLHFMAANFSYFQSMVVSQTVVRESGEGIRTFEETIEMKAPDRLRAALTEEPAHSARVIDRSFMRLLMTGTQAGLWDFLAGAGVDLGRVSYTRVDGTVAYLIGERGDLRPKLAVEKGRFLPLVFHYPWHLNSGRQFIRVIFKDFRQVDQGWFPFEITCHSDAGWSERHAVASVKANVPVELSPFHPLQKESPPAEGSRDNERIEEIIKSLEQKYRR